VQRPQETTVDSLNINIGLGLTLQTNASTEPFPYPYETSMAWRDRYIRKITIQNTGT